jgi:hypothetical protein
MKRRIDRTLPFVFKPQCKVVSIDYPEDPYKPGCLEFCGEHWEHFLMEFFTQKRFSRFGVYVDTENGMTAKAIEVSFAYDTPDEIIKDICEEAIQYMSTKVHPIYQPGESVVLISKDIEQQQWNGQKMTVIGLDEDNDIDENGFKYLLRAKDGTVISAFECYLD